MPPKMVVLKYNFIKTYIRHIVMPKAILIATSWGTIWSQKNTVITELVISKRLGLINTAFARHNLYYHKSILRNKIKTQTLLIN